MCSFILFISSYIHSQELVSPDVISLKATYDGANDINLDRFLYSEEPETGCIYEFLVEQVDSGISRVLTKPVNYFCINELEPEEIFLGVEYCVRVRYINSGFTSS
ncbi:hypothetical protein LJC11_04920 [Bacteroidales bacterium OttesenSCG-928-I21]|nr:hypothetical protein [Bacteroidales bacterium OttesenSCG-928-I21]